MEKKLKIQKRKNNNLSMVMIENDRDNTIIEASVMEEEEESIWVFGSTDLTTKINKKIKRFFSKRNCFIVAFLNYSLEFGCLMESLYDIATDLNLFK